MVARNRFLAESMLNGGSKTSQKSSYQPKYSVPTCHSTLKQLEQARLAKEFELQRRKSLQHHNNNNTAEHLAHCHTTSLNNNNTIEEVKLKRSLSGATSVGKLVNNFENGHFADNEEEEEVESLEATESEFYFHEGYATKPAIAVKPPLATKPILRHTVSVF